MSTGQGTEFTARGLRAGENSGPIEAICPRRQPEASRFVTTGGIAFREAEGWAGDRRFANGRERDHRSLPLPSGQDRSRA